MRKHKIRLPEPFQDVLQKKQQQQPTAQAILTKQQLPLGLDKSDQQNQPPLSLDNNNLGKTMEFQTSIKQKNNVCLIVIDGWGISDIQQGNAIANAQTPVMDSLAKNTDQYRTLDASGLAVGLPAGLMGNSEVGHLNIGAGRVIYQDIVRINLDVEKKV